MSAVVLTLSTHLFAIADSSGAFHLSDGPAGEYEMHVWIEGVPQPALNGITRRVRLSTGPVDLGTVEVPGGLPLMTSHKNMYGKSYDGDVKPSY
jgi:hypothetical protein